MQEEPKHKKTETSSSFEGESTNEDSKSVQLMDNRSVSKGAKAIQSYNANITQKKANNTGLPNQLKSGIESLSGHSMDDVEVHYNSSKPAQLNAHAYAKGNQIHLGPGQEKHLPHEAWHVVQQKQGRVSPTKQLKGKVNINDDKGLEKEADIMGSRALQMKSSDTPKKSGLKYVGSVLQLKLQSTSGWKPFTGTLPSPANTVTPGGTKPLTGSPINANVFVKTVKAQTKPHDLKGMTKWKKKNLLDDPSRSSPTTLTRMHAINGTFHGPSAADNMFLGTSASNNSSSVSHLHQVENPIRDFLKAKSTTFAEGVNYTVKPGYGTLPPYMIARIAGISNATERKDFESWAKQGVPATYTCTAVFYRKKSGALEYIPQQTETLKADVNATGSGAPSTKTILKLYTGAGSTYSIKVPWDTKKKEQSGLGINLGKTFIINKVKFDSTKTKDPVGKLTGDAFKKVPMLKKKELNFDINKRKGAFAGYFDRAAATGKINAELAKLSPVEFDEIELRDDGLYGEGDVHTTIPLIDGAGIKLHLEGDNIALEKKFSTSEFKLPYPFRVTKSELKIRADFNDVYASGELDFIVDKLGKGSLKAKVGTDEIYFVGDFDFDSQLFDESSMTLTYKDKKWLGQGILKIGPGKVPGLKGASAEATYGSEGFKISGNAKPNLHGINANLTLSYENGAFTLEGSGDYHNEILDGHLAIGFTNKVVGADGKPTSSVGNHFTPFGRGLLNIKLGKNLQAQAGAKLLRNGEIEMDGKIGISKPAEIFAKKSLEKELFDLSLKVPLYSAGLGIASVGLNGFLEARANMFAGIGPGTIDSLEGSVLYNPSHREKTRIGGDLKFSIGAGMGIKLTIPIGVEAYAKLAGFDMARGKGQLDLGGQLETKARANLDARFKWTPETGLEFEADPSAEIKSKLIFDIKAALSLYIIGLINEEWKYDVYRKEYDNLFDYNVEFPIRYKQGEPFSISKSDLKITKNKEPDLETFAEKASEQSFTEEHAKNKGISGVEESTGSTASPELVLYTSSDGSTPRKMAWPGGTTEKAVDDLNPPLSRLYEVDEITFNKGVGGKLKGVAFKGVKDIETVDSLIIDITKKEGDELAGLITPANVLTALTKKIVFENSGAAACFGFAELTSAQFDESGLDAEGKLTSNLEVVKNANFDFAIKDDRPSFRKKFSSGEFDVPSVLHITESSLIISADAKAIKAEGIIKFNVGELGVGELKASMNSEEGLNLEGELHLDPSYFDDGLVKVTYHDGVLKADGSAKLNLPGLKKGNMSIHISKTNVKAGGGFELEDSIPGISEGKVNADLVWKGGKKFGLTAEGSAKADIPGLKTDLGVKYENGAWTMKGEGEYEYGKLKGTVHLGVTNQDVDEGGNPTGTPGKKFSVFGGGDMKIEMAKWLTGEAGAKLLPNGEPELNGVVKLVRAMNFFDKKEFKQEPSNSPTVSIPLFAIPVWRYNIGLEGRIKGGMEASADIGPGALEELSATILYNPFQKSKNKLVGTAKIGAPTAANLRVFGNASIGTSALVASVHGGLEFGGSIGVHSPNSVEASIGWNGEKGFFLDATANAVASAKLKGDIKAILEVYIALYGTTKWDKTLAEKEVSSGLEFGVKAPIKYESGKGFVLTLSDLEFVKPTIDFSNLFKTAAEDSFQGSGEE